jgi:glycosyltransferase involved in cell wall biosynthesis
MRVLHLIDSLNSGGAERVLATTVTGLRHRGVRQAVHLLYGGGPLESLIPRDCRVFRNYGGTELVTAIRRFRPDVIQSWVDDGAVLAAPVAAALGLPLVHRIPNIPSAQYAVHPRGEGHVRRFRHALMSASRVCALSDAAADDTARYFGIERPTVIYNGYPLVGSPSKAVKHRERGTFLVVAVGRLSVEKGHRNLIAALPPVLARWPNVRCWIAGEGPLDAALAQQIDDLGLRGIVDLVGYYEDVQDVLRQADLFVMPSLYEGFGNALLQGMVAGLPVVVSDLPVVRQDILRGGTGAWLVTPGDVAGLTTAIDTLVADDGRRKDLAEQALAVSRRFQVSRMVDEYAALYADLAGMREAA